VAGRYRVIQHISRAEAFDVYEVWSDDRYCRCVLKLVRPDRVGEERVLRRLRFEGELITRLAHPHIVRGYEVLANPPAIVMEPLTGASLGYLIDDAPRRMRLDHTAILGTQLCSAASYLHAQGVVHLDLKPSNIIADGGIAKLIDFSLARAPGVTAKGVGTRGYLSPEQASGAMVSEAADVWGIGAVLYETAAGVRPYFPADRNERHPMLEGPPPSVRTRRRMPSGLADAIDACFAMEPGDRPSPRELDSMLAPFARP
jgi:eukaryotic-like serine/threonine-protein kinase